MPGTLQLVHACTVRQRKQHRNARNISKLEMPSWGSRVLHLQMVPREQTTPCWVLPALAQKENEARAETLQPGVCRNRVVSWKGNATWGRNPMSCPECGMLMTPTDCQHLFIQKKRANLFNIARILNGQEGNLMPGVLRPTKMLKIPGCLESFFEVVLKNNTYIYIYIYIICIYTYDIYNMICIYAYMILTCMYIYIYYSYIYIYIIHILYLHIYDMMYIYIYDIYIYIYIICIYIYIIFIYIYIYMIFTYIYNIYIYIIYTYIYIYMIFIIYMCDIYSYIYIYIWYLFIYKYI